MRIIDLLKSGAIELNTSVATKEEAIDKLVALHDAVGNLADRQEYKHEILLREEQGSHRRGYCSASCKERQRKSSGFVRNYG